MNKLVISCPPGAVSVMDSRLEATFSYFFLRDLLSFTCSLMTISSFAGFGKDGGVLAHREQSWPQFTSPKKCLE